MIIEKVEVWDFCPPMRDGPYAMSHVVMDCIWGRIFRVTADRGLTGWGEVVFPPSAPREEQLALISREPEILGNLLGQPTDTLLELAQDLRKLGKSGCGFAFGLETLWYDLQARHRGVPVSALLGGAKSDAVPDYFSISERTQERLRERMEIAGPERSVFQLKLGIGSYEDDLEQVSLMLDQVSSPQIVLADANGGWEVDRACRTIAAFDDPRLVWEEPCNTYDENRIVMERTGAGLMIDQCAADPAIAARVIDDGLAHSLCIKPAFLGGLSVAQEIRDQCADAGTSMRIDGPWCGDIASAAILHLAVGASPDLLIASCDLREPVLIDLQLGGVRSYPNTTISPPEGPGLGINVPDRSLGSPEAVYQ